MLLMYQTTALFIPLVMQMLSFLQNHLSVSTLLSMVKTCISIIIFFLLQYHIIVLFVVVCCQAIDLLWIVEDCLTTSLKYSETLNGVMRIQHNLNSMVLKIKDLLLIKKELIFGKTL